MDIESFTSLMPRENFGTILDVDKISIVYDSGLQATWDVSFSVKETSITALVGSNGAGKTTILRAISGTLSQAHGDIHFQGENVNNLTPNQRVELGISLIPEGRRVFPYMTVQENLEIGAYSKRARTGISRTLDQVFELFPRLAERKKQMAGSLSGGEQQMLAIGRGLMSRPLLLMLDEPSLGLAPLIVKHVFEIIETINREGVTILLVEQNVNMSLEIADEAYVLETGKITLKGSGRDLLKNPYVKKSYLGL